MATVEEATPSPLNPTWNKHHGGAKVAIIGCGPGGMFVCHAVESERQKLQQLLKEATNDQERHSLQSQIDRLPSVVCFEQADAPGGVWRSTKTTDSSFKTDTNMYEALWCNGPKEVMEFADYTFEDHFGKGSKLPLFLPRQAVLDYILSRVTRNCPQFFEQYAQFQTRVNRVTYDAAANEFTVETMHLPTQTTATAIYDKVIWSAGQNGVGKIPGPILHAFQDAQKAFAEQQPAAIPPPFLHAGSMEQKVAGQIQGRHLLLIGGSYSAEDLAFMGIKWGAKQITILARRQGIDVPVCWTTNWPENKVTVVTGYVVNHVDVLPNNQHFPQYRVTLKKYANETNYMEVDETKIETIEKEEPLPQVPSSSLPSLETPYSPISVVIPEMIKTIDSVDVVICCTGYKEQLRMLHKSCYNMTDKEYKIYVNERDILDLPEDWTMPENSLTGIIEKYYAEEIDSSSSSEEESDDSSVEAPTSAAKASTTPTANYGIPPKRDSLYPGYFVHPYTYRDFVFVHNPNLMLLNVENFDAPLLALDVLAHLAVKFITGQRQMPTLEQMKSENYQQALMEMGVPMIRYWLDANYFNAVQKWLSDTTKKIYYQDAKGNRCSRFEYPEEWEAAFLQISRLELQLLARLMQEAEYPLQLGSFQELNENGEKFMQINFECRNYETCPVERTTFRDGDAQLCSLIQSVFTGAQPVPLNGRWLDMDDFMENVSEMVS